MCDYLGVRNFCAACKGSKEENGELVCKDKTGRLYGLPVKDSQNKLCPLMCPLKGSDHCRNYGMKRKDKE